MSGSNSIGSCLCPIPWNRCICNLVERGKLVVMVTHQLQFAQQADLILAINKDVSGMRMRDMAAEMGINIEHGIIASVPFMTMS